MNKAVIYLDQFAISNIFRIRSGERLRNDLHDNWVEFDRRISRALLTQCAIFPPSDVHLDETIVSRFASGLRVEHEMFGGEASLKDTRVLQAQQQYAFAAAFLETRPAPTLPLEIDEAIKGDRNEWLSIMHITANSDLSSFAADLRRQRDAIHAAMLHIFDRWKTTKPSFQDVLDEELAAYGPAKQKRAAIMLRDTFAAHIAGDTEKSIDSALSAGARELSSLKKFFESRGINEEESMKKVFQFWSWPELRHIPHHRIASHMYAALAARFAAGQRATPTKGFNNDITAISTYAPYVDAMFVDNECESILSDGRLRKALDYRAKIFCPRSSCEFFSYLEALESNVSAAAQKKAAFIYRFGG